MTFQARDLALEIIEPGDVTFFRLFCRPDAEWEPPPAVWRNERYDPPPGKKEDYALLYTADRLEATAVECRILAADRQDIWSYDAAAAEKYKVARYSFVEPAIFIPMDRNRVLLGLDKGTFVPGYLPWQRAAHDLWRRFGTTVMGLSWVSMHRQQIGRVYAIWHHRKDAIGLVRPTGPLDNLCDDPEWMLLLQARPDIEKLVAPSPAPAVVGTPPSVPPPL